MLYAHAADVTYQADKEVVYATSATVNGQYSFKGALTNAGGTTASHRTVYVFWGDHWYGTTDTSNPGRHNDQATYVFQPLVFNGTKISMPTYHSPWTLDVGLGTWQ